MSTRILIVDDDPGSVRHIGLALMPEYRCEFALSGAQALIRLATEAPPALLLVDVMMPGMDGYTFCRELQASARLKEIPAICITARQDPETECQALRAGAVDFISKPIDPLVLRLRIELQLRLRRQELALRASRAQLDMALESSGIGFWRQASATGRLTWTGQHAALLGLPREQLSGTLDDWMRSAHPDDRYRLRADLQGAREGAGEFEHLYRFQRPDGQSHWVQIRGRWLQEDGSGESRSVLIGTSRAVSNVSASS